MSHFEVNCPISKGRCCAGAQTPQLEKRDLKLQITKAGPALSRSPGARELFAHSPETRIKGMLASWKGPVISSAGQETCFYLITHKAFMQHPKDICTTAGTHQFMEQTPAGVLTPALEAVLCGSIWCGSLSHLPSQCLCQTEAAFLHTQWQTKREEETWEAQQISYCAIHLMWQHSGGRGWKPSTSSGALACSSRNRLGQDHAISTTTCPIRASINDLVHHIKNMTAQVSHPCTNWGTPTNNMGGQREVLTLDFPPSNCLVRCAGGWMSAARRYFFDSCKNW